MSYASAAVLTLRLDRRVDAPAPWVLNITEEDTPWSILRVYPRSATPGSRDDVVGIWTPGGPQGRLMCASTDEHVVATVLDSARQLGDAFHLRTCLRSAEVHRWHQTLPEFPADHVKGNQGVQRPVLPPVPYCVRRRLSRRPEHRSHRSQRGPRRRADHHRAHNPRLTMVSGLISVLRAAAGP